MIGYLGEVSVHISICDESRKDVFLGLGQQGKERNV